MGRVIRILKALFIRRSYRPERYYMRGKRSTRDGG